MDHRKFVIFLIIFIFQYYPIYGNNTNIHFKDESQLFLNDKCTDNLSDGDGICRYLKDCQHFLKTGKYMNQVDRATICGFENKNVIVCCPDTEEEVKNPDIINNSDAEAIFIPFNEMCILPGSNKFGILKREMYCPFAMEQQANGIQLPRACTYEICHDIVCCPDTPRSRLRQHCNYEWAGSPLTTRLYINSNCKVSGTNQIGRYTSSDTCSYYTDDILKNITLPKVCDWDWCEDIVCCPETTLTDSECRIAPDINFDYVDFDAGKCIKKDTGEPGLCTSEQNCPNESFQNNKNATICGYDCCSSFVCCPLPELTKLSSNERACFTYKKEVFEEIKLIKFLDSDYDKTRQCQGIKPSGGQLAFPREFPHMAVLGYDGPDLVKWSCGGSLISERFVLTAAHCLESEGVGSVKYVRIGIIDLNVTTDQGDCPEEYLIEQIIPHPNYLKRLNYNDIGLLKLDRIVKFNPDIRPICLPTSSKIPNTLIAIGFGLTMFDGQRTEQLIKVKLEYFNHRECNESYKFNFNRKFQGLNDVTQFCAGSRDSIQDTCPGDSGGPIEADHVDYYKMKIIYGITSFGKACGFKGSPAIYTTVYPFVEWIESIVWPKNY